MFATSPSNDFLVRPFVPAKMDAPAASPHRLAGFLTTAALVAGVALLFVVGLFLAFAALALTVASVYESSSWYPWLGATVAMLYYSANGCVRGWERLRGA